jgi:hypothetical protein
VEQTNLRDTAETLGAFIRAGVTPTDAARLAGLTGEVEFVDAMPITLKPKPLLDAEVEKTQSEAQ